MQNVQFSRTTDRQFMVSTDQSASTTTEEQNPNFSIGNTSPFRVIEKPSSGMSGSSQDSGNQDKPVDVEVQEAMSKYNYSMFS